MFEVGCHTLQQVVINELDTDLLTEDYNHKHISVCIWKWRKKSLNKRVSINYLDGIEDGYISSKNKSYESLETL